MLRNLFDTDIGGNSIWQRRFQIILLSISVMFLWSLAGSANAQEEAAEEEIGVSLVEERQNASTYLYSDCKLDDENQPTEMIVRMNLSSPRGQPLDPSEITVRDTTSNEEFAITPERWRDEAGSLTHEPIQLILVVDKTYQYPTEELGALLSDITTGQPDYLFARDYIGITLFDVDPENIDELALDDDHSRRFNRDSLAEFVSGTSNQAAGTAVLYDGIMAALEIAEQSSDLRSVILVMSDSKHNAPEPTAQQVIDRAVAANAQIFAMMWKSDFDTNIEDIVEDTNGYFWKLDASTPGYDGTDANFVDRMHDYLKEADAILNNEYTVRIPLGPLTKDENATVEVALSTQAGPRTVQLGEVSCNAKFGPHTIAFGEVPEADQFVKLSDPLEISFQVDPPATTAESLTYKLWFNGAPFGDDSDDFDETIEVSLDTLASNQLLDDLNVGGENVLMIEVYREGETEAIAENTLDSIIMQQRLLITCGTGENTSCSGLTGATSLTAVLEGGQALPSGQFVHFQMQADGGTFQDLNDLGSVAPVTTQGAVFPLGNINTTVTELFGDSAENLQVRAFIGDNYEDAIFVSNPIPLTVSVLTTVEPTLSPDQPTVAATAEVQAPVQPEAEVPINPLIAPLGFAGLLVLIDIILLRRIRVARVKRLMRFPDNLELPGTPMKITAMRNGQSQMHVLSKRTMNLGRGSSNDINLPDDTNVSREHGLVMWRRGQWLYTNRKPETRVSIDQKNVKGFRARPLRDGTQMQVGDYRLVCHYDMDADPNSLMETQF